MQSYNEYENCFACGKNNEIGLKLDFEYYGNEAKSFFMLNKNYEGYPNIIHGGIISTIMDEAMAKVILANDIVALTVELNVKYRNIMQIEEKYNVISRIEREVSRAVYTSAEIKNESNKIIATANAKFIKQEKSKV